ncbi:hypothetical protein LOTGIDRAFT_231138 [Lottia gigantea]|uniref:Uncharacterized protein n=1 Tax=Lottia gigantea TaxID=225164 RepID=V4CA87_LOTGI|nr:hypothetical protein LOTGIDRAFT_231138 [Lottia gigantea]ESO98714.1 hypothetical protein LOTGIDRAFT_231138 [Lottia gigantea]
MQLVLGILAIVVLEIFSTGNGANISNQNRGYIIDLPSRLIRGNKHWSEYYNRREPNKPTTPVLPAVKHRPNYLSYKDTPSIFQTERLDSNFEENQHGNRYPSQSFEPSLHQNEAHTQSGLAPPRTRVVPPPPHTRPISPPPHQGVVPPPNDQGVAPLQSPSHSGVSPPKHSQSIIAPPPVKHQGVASQPPPHTGVVQPPPHQGVAPPPPPHQGVAPPPPPHHGVAPPPNMGLAPLPTPTHTGVAPLPPPPPFLGVIPERFPHYNPRPKPISSVVSMPSIMKGISSEQRKPSYSVHISGNVSDKHNNFSPYVDKNQYLTEGKIENSIYQHMPTTFWKTVGYFHKDRKKRTIFDDEDRFHDWEFDEDNIRDWEFGEEYEDPEHGDKEGGHIIHDLTDDHKRRKRWSENNGDCQDCEMSDESGEEQEYNADPWNYDDNDSDESSQTETWDSGKNNNDYTWKNEDNNDDYTLDNDDNDDDYTWNDDDNDESSQTDTWSNNEQYSWNNGDATNSDNESDVDETDNTYNTDDNDYKLTDEGSYKPADPKPRPQQPPPEHNRQTAYPRKPKPPPRRKPGHGPLSRYPQTHQPFPRPQPHRPKLHRPQNRPGPVHDPRPSKSHPPESGPGPSRGSPPSASSHNYPIYQLPIPPAPPRHPQSPPYPSEHLQYDFDYEECED